MHGDDLVCLSDDDGFKHIDSLLKSKYTVKDMGTLGFEDSDVKSLLLLNRVFRVGGDQTGQYLDIKSSTSYEPKRIELDRNLEVEHQAQTRDRIMGDVSPITEQLRKMLASPLFRSEKQYEQQTYAQRWELQDAHHGHVESRREQVRLQE